MQRSIVITGASSGIGEGLAREMARRGYRLGLCARRVERLESLAKQIRAESPGVHVETSELDVCDYDRVAGVLDDLAARLAGVDIVCVNAGVGSAGRLGEGHFERDRKLIETNVIGALATVDAAVSRFRAQGHGHIVAISSVSAFRGLPTTAAYSASKAALSSLMEGLEAELHGSDIHVTTLHPGFIDTAINREVPSRPFLIDVAKGASIIADLIERRVRRSTVPVFPWNVVGWLLKRAPVSVLARVAR